MLRVLSITPTRWIDNTEFDASCNLESYWVTETCRQADPVIEILAEKVFPKDNDTSSDSETEPMVDNLALLSTKLPYR